MTLETEYLLPEAEDNPYRLGRNVAHDSRSRSFAFSEPSIGIATRSWKRLVPIYDQGAIGSCTLNAALGCISTKPFNRHFRSQRVIQKYYSETTRIDPFEGSWPPDDTGSDGNSAAKTLRNHKLITEWRHCFSFNDVLAALQTGPIITGTAWYQGMFVTHGELAEVFPTGRIVGGHEYILCGVDVEQQFVRAANSWSTNWGDRGYFTISFDNYRELLADDGDATVLIK
jgi:hypothetical protein